MMKMHRTDVPDCLTKIDTGEDNSLGFPKWKYWGLQWARKKEAAKEEAEKTGKKEKTPVFTWHNTRETLSEKLLDCTNQHCSFCDGYPMRSEIKDTIEHFRRKEQHPLLAYYWHNLFIACHICQEIPAKWDKKDDKLVLKPDDLDYDFGKYFLFDMQTGEIRVNKFAKDSDQKRAEKTIFYYKLNEYARPKARLDALKLYINEPDFNNRKYRFMFL